MEFNYPTSKLRGHIIVYKNNQWMYKDTGTLPAENERPCSHCGKNNTKEGHDNCLGTLVGVKNACCGHGVNKGAYIQYCSGREIRGSEAINEFQRLKLKVWKRYARHL